MAKIPYPLVWVFIGAALFIAPVFATAESQKVKAQVQGPLSVLVLGSGGPEALATGRASAGYLIFLDGEPKILMDVGGGTFARLAESGVQVAGLDIILLSHLHIDHTADLSSVIKTIYFHSRGENLATQAFPPGRTASIRIIGPDANGVPFPPVLPALPDKAQYPSLSEYVHGHYDLNVGTERYLNLFSRAISGGSFAVEPIDVKPDWQAYDPITLADRDGLLITAVGVNHGPVPALAFRVDYKGRSLVYSGDTSSLGDNMIRLAEHADLLIYDTAITDELPDGPNDEVFFALHTTPTRMGEVASAASAKMLLLSHITRVTESRLPQVRQSVRAQGYRGFIREAKDLMVINVGKRHKKHPMDR